MTRMPRLRLLGDTPCDIAAIRDRSTGLKRKVFAVCALGWEGSDSQWRHYRRGYGLLAALATLAREHDALLAVDNVFCTPVLQKPLELGADIVVHSATKYLDGQGRIMGGAVVGSKVGSQVRFGSPLHATLVNVVLDPTTERPSRPMTRPSDCAPAGVPPAGAVHAPLLRKRDMGATNWVEPAAVIAT